MKVSVLLGSARPGGIDISFAGLKAQTYQDFEIVFVDALYHRRHRKVLEYAKKIGLNKPLIHVPNHRYRSDLWGAACAGFNTAFALADGELVVFLMDYAWAPPDWIAQHVRLHEAGLAAGEKRLVIGNHVYYHLDADDVVTRSGRPAAYFPDSDRQTPTPEVMAAVREDFDPISIFPHEPQRRTLMRRKRATFPGITATGPLERPVMFYFFTKNESFPLEAALDVNGMDEFYDSGRGPGDTDIGERLATWGLEGYGSAEATLHCLNPRNIMPNPNTSAPENERPKPPHEHRHSHAEGCKYLESRRGQKHALNPGKSGLSPCTLYRLREDIWDWREKSQEKKAVLPYNMVSDEDYFG